MVLGSVAYIPLVLLSSSSCLGFFLTGRAFVLGPPKSGNAINGSSIWPSSLLLLLLLEHNKERLATDGEICLGRIRCRDDDLWNDAEAVPTGSVVVVVVSS